MKLSKRVSAIVLVVVLLTTVAFTSFASRPVDPEPKFGRIQASIPVDPEPKFG